LKSGPESGPDLYVGSELRFVAWSKTGLSWSQWLRSALRTKLPKVIYTWKTALEDIAV